MATIRPNDNAPAEDVKYLLGNAEIDLPEGGSYDTDDRYVIAAAEAHPWLTVEFPEVEELGEVRVSKSVPYADDVLAAPNSQAFDLDKLAAEQADQQAVLDSRLAVDAGLDQSEPQQVGGVDVTLAGADTANDEKPTAKRSAKKGS